MASLWRRDRDAEIREEFDTHLALEAARLIAARDAQSGAEPVAIVSQSFWETRLGRRDEVIGSTITLHGRDTTVVA